MSSSAHFISITTDGDFIYSHSISKGLVKVIGVAAADVMFISLFHCLKIGTGSNGTIAGRVYSSIDTYHNKDLLQLACVGDYLYVRSSKFKLLQIEVLSCKNLEVNRLYL